MKRLHLLLGFALLIVLVGVSPASAQPERQGGTQGGVQMTIHTHSNDDPEWSGLLFDTDRLSYNFVQGESFSYSSRTCGGRAPFNDLGLDFSPDYPGVDDDQDGTAAVRHHVEGTITQVRGDTGTIEGTITSVMCLDGQETENVIVTHYTARFHRVSDNEIRISGRFHFSPTESTGTFAGLEGQDRSRESSPAWRTSGIPLSPPAPCAATSPTSSEPGET